MEFYPIWVWDGHDPSARSPVLRHLGFHGTTCRVWTTAPCSYGKITRILHGEVVEFIFSPYIFDGYPLVNIHKNYKHTKNYGKSPCWMGKSTISMASFNSYVTNDHVGSPFSKVKSPFFPVKAAVTLAFGCIATARGVVRSVRIAGRLLQQMLGAAMGYWMILGMFFHDYWRYHLVI